ncbi:phospholipase [Microbacterium sp.]|uniref:aggregation-promoting factor C-terminal-like domain-containing protein n=1 Tax=Microbacterium sp. TaxID=51671 RepID=UPI002D78BF6C|nr:phospholipase [Microbacterium sp.]HET6302423.1 phospholipase [Microbacterium sp.]
MLSTPTSALPAAPAAPEPAAAPKRRRAAALTAGAVLGTTIGLVALTGFTAASMPLASGASAAVASPVQVAGTALAALTDTSEPALFEKIAADADAALRATDNAVERAKQVEADAAASGLDLGEGPTTIDTKHLRAAAERVENFVGLPPMLPSLTKTVIAHLEDVVTETNALRARHDAAAKAKAEAEAAAAAAAAAAAEAQRKAEEAAAALAAANTVEGAQAIARDLAASQYGWGGDQFSCLVNLWNRESGWNYQAYNAGSGATGIPQALPGSKMATAGPDWQTSARTQIVWGLDYIARAYGSPCGAWGHSNAFNWY